MNLEKLTYQVVDLAVETGEFLKQEISKLKRNLKRKELRKNSVS